MKISILGSAILAATVFLLQSPAAHAVVDFAADYECPADYSQDCMLKFNTQRVFWLTYHGTVRELGQWCSLQTQKISLQIPKAEAAAGANRGDIEYSRPHVKFSGGTGEETELVCTYTVRSTRKDLRFVRKKLRSRLWTSPEEQMGICMDDVREAELIAGSLGAGRSMVASLLQGQMCSSVYALAGLDRVVSDGQGGTRIVKFGSHEYDMMEAEKAHADANRAGYTQPILRQEPLTP